MNYFIYTSHHIFNCYLKNNSLLISETRERQRTVRFADEVEQSGGEDHASKGAGTTSIQDFLLKMAGQPLPDKQVHIDYVIDYQTVNVLYLLVVMHKRLG